MLLIAPSGIEIRQKALFSRFGQVLLIAPSGIEIYND